MDSPNAKEIAGKNIRRLREKKNLTQEQVAKKAKLKSTNYFAVIERGEVETSTTNYIKIAKVLGVRVDDLFN